MTYGWFLKGSRPTVKYLHKRKEKHCVLGALSKDDFFYQITEKNLNSQIFEKFIISLLEKFKKVVIVLDQARYHTSYYMQDIYKEYEDNLHVEYFPSYSPELDPTEQVWREVKKWLGMKYWRTTDELKEQLILAFEEDFVMVPIYDYLLP